ncbi:MAG: PKD domain-containing protein [Bacteroidales bacterium]
MYHLFEYRSESIVLSKGWLLLFIGFFIFWNIPESNGQDGDCPLHIVDLTADPGASVFLENLEVDDQCCGAPSNHNCFTIELNLHPDANGVVIAFSTAQGNTHYYVNCEYKGITPSDNIIYLCFDGPGPHYFTFCRTGTPTYDLIITSMQFDEVDVTLPPFDDVCVDDPLFYFNEVAPGSPSGGSYYVDGVLAFWFDPAVYGPGIYEITYVYEDPDTGCIGSDTQYLTVHDLPEVTLDDLEVCMYEDSYTLTGGSPAGGFYFGDYISGGEFDIGASGPGTFEFFYGYEDANGCYNEASAFITVYELPLADAGPDQTIVTGTTANLSAAAGGTGNYSYYWEPAAQVDNPNSQNTTTVPLFVTTVFTLTVVDDDTGCVSTDQVIIYVIGGDLEIVGLDGVPDEICMGEEVQLSVLVSGGSGNYEYTWTSNPPDPSLVGQENIPDPLVTPTVTTTYYIDILDVDWGISVDGEVTITVNPLPNVTLDPFDPICGSETYFELTGGSPAGGTYSIPTMGLYDITSINPVELGSGSYIVVYEYVDVNGCTGSASEPLTIHPRVNAKFHPQRTFCESHEVTFLNLSENGTSFEWHIDGNVFFTNNMDPVYYEYAVPADYEYHTVVLIAEDDYGCTDTYTKEFKLTPPVVAEFTPDDEQIGCSPLELNFQNNSYGPILFHLWNFGDGNFSIADDPTHVFHNYTDTDTTYVVYLTTISESFLCSDYDSLLVTVHPYIEAGFGFTPSEVCAPYEITIEDTSIGAHTYEYSVDGVPFSNLDDPFVYYTFDNFTDAPVEYVITQEVSNPQGCTDIATDTITVNPYIESGFNPSQIEGCAPLAIDFEDTAIGVVDHYFYDFDDGGNSVLSDPSHTFNNKTNSTIVYTVMQVVASEYFCADTSYIDITVHPELVADFSFAPEAVCNLSTVDFSSDIVAYSGYTFYWDFGDGSPPVFDVNEVSHFYEHDDPNPVTYTVSLVAESAESCISIAEKEITVYPKIIADIDANPISGCSPLNVDFANNTSGGNTYYWTFGDGGTSAEFDPSHVFTNEDYDNPVTYTVEMVAESQYFCKDTTEMDITVLPGIKADFFIENVEGCSPFEVTIENYAQGADSYLWDFGDGSPVSNSGDPQITHTYTNTTNAPIDYVISLDIENVEGCSDFVTHTITVYPEVTSDFSYLEEGCSPHNPEFNNLSENADYYYWQMGDGIVSTRENPEHLYYNHSYTDIATFDVSLFSESVYGCNDLINRVITVFPRPDVAFMIENPSGCSPHEAIFHNLSIGVDDLLWDFGDGNTGTQNNATFTYLYEIDVNNVAQIYDVVLDGSNSYGCDNSYTQQVSVYPDIIAAFDVNIIEGCHPLTVEFDNLSSGATAYTAYYWDYGDGHTSTSNEAVHSHTFNNYSYTDPVTYEVMLIANNANACSDTTYHSITVNPRPQANFSVPNHTGCSPHEIQIEDYSEGASVYQWDMDDGNVFNYTDSFTHEYTQPAGAGQALFTINLEVENAFGCSHSYEQIITVYPDISAEFDVVDEGCHPLDVDFNNSSEGVHYHFWDFGDGNTSQEENPSHTFFNHDFIDQEFFDVDLVVVSEYGCTDYYTTTITVNPLPLAAFYLSETAGCSPFEALIENYSIGAVDYLWDFGDGNNSTDENDFSYTWNNTTLNPLNYNLNLSVENIYGCEDLSSQTIAVYPEVTVDFDTEDGLYEGCSHFNVQFVSSTNLGVTMFWDFGDGNTSTSVNPLHVFSNYTANTIDYEVALTATSAYNCFATTTDVITVLASPLADFRATPMSQPFPDATVYLENLTSPGNFSYIWDFDDGNVFNTDSRDPFYHTYEREPDDYSTILYETKLTAYNEHCSDSIVKIITITSPVPIADFSPSTQGCAPLTVQFENHSVYSYDYRWYFGDGAMSVEESPIHTFVFPGVYDVMLVAIGDGGQDTTYQTVEVFQNPTALFEIASLYVQIPDEPLRLVNLSSLAEFYYWDFGDNNTSTDFEPVHYYDEPGLYDIMLAVSTDTDPQCHDTLILENAVRVDELCQIVFPNAFTPSITGSSGGYYDPANITNEVFFPLYQGIQDYELTIFNRWGELIFRSTDPLIGWDGYHRGSLAPQGVYVWKFNGLCTNGNSITKSGTVTLIR